MNPEPNTTPICGRAVPYRDDVIDIDQLRFWEGNPRVCAAVRGLPEWPKADSVRRQQLIADCMEKQESTRRVLEGLRIHEGQQEPLIIDLRGNVVIEGNSRLSALLVFARDDPGQWGAAICRCYNDLTDEERFALIAEMHVIGKTEWTPYAKAVTYWRQHHELKWNLATIARVNRTTVQHVKAQLATVDLMAKQNELNERKHSWYGVLTSVQSVKRVFEDNSAFRSRILDVVRDAGVEAVDPVSRASNTFRDALTALVKKDRPLRQFCTGRKTLQEAADEARMTSLAAKLRKARDVLQSIDRSDFVGLTQADVNDASNTFRRLRKDVEVISQFFTDESPRVSRDA